MSNQPETKSIIDVADNTSQAEPSWYIDRFEVIELIGTGAMGIVYRVHDSKFSCDRALKILRKELVDDVDIVARFREEGRSAVRAGGEISHPNIVTVFDTGVFESRPFIVMELFRGVPLDAMMAKKQFTIGHVLEIGAQLASALNSAHKHGVVHRDIKPANVLMSENGNLAKLTDFSVARVHSDKDNSLTRTGVVIGAPRYMPPEQALGKDVDGRSDLYGLGVVLYELLTGQKAYQSDTFTALLIEIAQSDPKPVRSHNKDIPPGVERVISKLLSKSPDRRYQTGAELEEALRRELANIDSAEMRAQRGIPTELMGAALLGLIVSMLMGLTGYMLRNQQVTAFNQQTAAVGSAYANSLARQISLDYARSGVDSGLLYQAQFQENIGDSNLDFQHIVLNDGRVLASTSTEVMDQGYLEPEILEMISSPEEPVIASFVKTASGVESLQIAKTIEVGAANKRRMIGTLYVGLDTERINEISKLTVKMMLLMTGLVSLLIGLVSYFLIRRFAWPLERLRDGMNSLASGDSDVRMTAIHTGLIGQTFAAFNKAAGAVSVQKDSDVASANINAPVRADSQVAPNFSREPVKPSLSSEPVLEVKDTQKPMSQEKVKPSPSKSKLDIEPTTETTPQSAKTKTKVASKPVIAKPMAKKVTKVKKAAPKETKSKKAKSKKTTAQKTSPRKAVPKKPATSKPKSKVSKKPTEKAATQPSSQSKKLVRKISVVNTDSVPVDDRTRIFKPE